jgi:3-isopropylmalate/(R)-2-methylmalate dehydratase small subunit
VVDESTAGWLLEHPGADIEIDLQSNSLSLPTGAKVPFPIEAFARHCLLNGIDELGYLTSKLDLIQRYETTR